MSAHLSLAPAETTTIDDWSELATRETDGLGISLLWSKSADRVKVTVLDQRHEEYFDIHVAGADALEAFYHPIAYTLGEAA